LDTAQVAEVLGVREAAVRTRLWRALARLRGIMEEAEE
jgi:DNA-directed RNA polymerase specialized sigma24 family protein